MPYRLLLVKHLGQAEEFLAASRERISAQTRIIENMEKAGQDTDLATTVLSMLEHSHELLEADVVRLRSELAKLPASEGGAGSEADENGSYTRSRSAAPPQRYRPTLYVSPQRLDLRHSSGSQSV